MYMYDQQLNPAHVTSPVHDIITFPAWQLRAATLQRPLCCFFGCRKHHKDSLGWCSNMKCCVSYSHCITQTCGSSIHMQAHTSQYYYFVALLFYSYKI